ncbi:MAG: response regulator transcription factor [Anaerolineae bacterium]
MNNNSPISVLLVDENLTFLRIVMRFLDAHDDIVIVGAVGEDEKALTQVQNLEPDVVLIELAMPNLPDGLQFIPRLRAVLPGVGIIALTLIGTDGYRQAALEAGVDDFVPKAAMGADLLSAIRRVKRANRTREKVTNTVET